MNESKVKSEKQEEQNAITTTHELDFKVAPWDPGDTFLGRMAGLSSESEYLRFLVGTCDGLWTSRGGAFVILSIVNADPGNGHLEDVMQWFYYSCKNAGKDFVIEELMNKKFKMHLIQKRGFHSFGDNHLIKEFPSIVREYDLLMKDVTINLKPKQQ